MNNKQLSDAEVNSSGLLKIDKPNVLNDKKTDNSNQLNNRPRQNMAQQNLSKGGQKPRQQQNNDLKQTDALIKPPKDNAQQQSSGKKSEIKQKVFGALPDKKSKLKVIFLGGVGEIGKNLTAFEYNDSIVIIDAGIAFPSADMPGVDVVIPDYTYLVENKRKIKAILLTHGHEDHIGGVPFLVKKLGIKKLPLFGSKLTLGLVENKLLEHNCLDLVSFNTIDDRSVVNFGEFVAEF
ncbi:MAG: ribonuclease J, partial [Clostridia bacterium]